MGTCLTTHSNTGNESYTHISCQHIREWPPFPSVGPDIGHVTNVTPILIHKLDLYGLGMHVEWGRLMYLHSENVLRNMLLPGAMHMVTLLYDAPGATKAPHMALAYQKRGYPRVNANERPLCDCARTRVRQVTYVTGKLSTGCGVTYVTRCDKCHRTYVRPPHP